MDGDWLRVLSIGDDDAFELLRSGTEAAVELPGLAGSSGRSPFAADR